MDVHRTDRRLSVRLRRDFNLLTARRLERLAADADAIHIDLARARLVDSEGLMLLYRLVRAGKTVTLESPPPLLAEAIAILGLEPVLNLEALVV